MCCSILCDGSIRSFQFTGISAYILECHLQERTLSTLWSILILKPRKGNDLWSTLSLWTLATIDYCAGEIHPGVSLWIQITLLSSGLWHQNKNKSRSTQNNTDMHWLHIIPDKRRLLHMQNQQWFWWFSTKRHWQQMIKLETVFHLVG